jgi:hypothetical protein
MLGENEDLQQLLGRRDPLVTKAGGQGKWPFVG